MFDKKRGDGELLIPYEDKHPGFGDRIVDEFFRKQARDCPSVKLFFELEQT